LTFSTYDQNRPRAKELTRDANMSAKDLLRLAWQADRDGQAALRDALMTLGVVESGPGEVVAAERCRRWLITTRPDHWLASFQTLGQALGHPHVVQAIGRLRATFPAARVQHLLLRNDAARGPYTGNPAPSALLLDELLAPTAGVFAEFDIPTPAPAVDAEPRSDEVPAFPFPVGGSAAAATDGAADPAALLAFYQAVLFAIAMLLAIVIPATAKDNKAA
jgi:hypothetical protein